MKHRNASNADMLMDAASRWVEELHAEQAELEGFLRTADRLISRLRELNENQDMTVSAQDSALIHIAMERFEENEIQSLIKANWTRTSVQDVENLEEAIAMWKNEKVTRGMLYDGDASRGRVVYNNTCGTCHRLFAGGQDIGPNLTGSNRANLDYILENVLAPNAVVSKDYLVNIFNLKDGRVISGMISNETSEVISVAMPRGTIMEFAPGDVEERTELQQSLMPAGLFDNLPVEDVSDLIKYLASPEQVPVPGCRL